MSLDEAHKYVKGLKDKKIRPKWRMPTLEEAMSLMEPKKNEAGLYIDYIFGKTQWMIWTTDKRDASFAWAVYFSGGVCYDPPVYSSGFVRAVR